MTYEAMKKAKEQIEKKLPELQFRKDEISGEIWDCKVYLQQLDAAISLHEQLESVKFFDALNNDFKK